MVHPTPPARPATPVYRRHLLLSSSASGAAAVLAACGAGAAAGHSPGAAKSGPPKKVVFVKTQASEIRDNAWRETFKLAQNATNVEAELVLEPVQGFYDKRQAEYAGGSASADITLNALNFVLVMGLKGMLVDHYPYLKRDKVDTSQYYKADFDSWAWKGKLWAMTFQAGGEAVMYNKQLFNAKGVKLPHKDWTYDDLLQACQKLNDPASNMYAIQIGQNGLQYMMGTFLRNFGGKVLNDARSKALYGDDPNALKGAELNVDLHQKYRVAWTADLLKSLPPGTTPMRSKLAAMEINGVTSHIDIRAAIGAENLDFAPPPKGPSGIQQARLAGNSWSIISLSPHIDDAWTMLRWLHTREGLLSPQLAALSWPPLVWAANAPLWADQFKGTRIADVQEVWQKAGHNQVVLPEGDAALQSMNGPVNQALAGEISTRQALRESADKLNQLFSQRPAEWN